MSDQVLESLEASLLLAEAWQMATPDFPLSWNPMDYESFTQAAERFLEQVSETLFPVYVGLVINARQALTFIPANVQGFDLWDTSISELPPDIDRLIATLVWLYEGLWEPEDEASILLELSQLYTLNCIVPAPYLLNWLEENKETHPAIRYSGWMRWRGLADLIRYFQGDTGHWWLDATYEDLRYELLTWDRETIDILAAEWRSAKIVYGRIQWFMAWSLENRAYVLAVLQEAMREIANAGCEGTIYINEQDLMDYFWNEASEEE